MPSSTPSSLPHTHTPTRTHPHTHKPTNPHTHTRTHAHTHTSGEPAKAAARRLPQHVAAARRGFQGLPPRGPRVEQDRTPPGWSRGWPGPPVRGASVLSVAGPSPAARSSHLEGRPYSLLPPREISPRDIASRYRLRGVIAHPPPAVCAGETRRAGHKLAKSVLQDFDQKVRPEHAPP